MIGFLFITNIDTSISWISKKQIFKVEENGVINTSWKNNKDWIKIYS